MLLQDHRLHPLGLLCHLYQQAVLNSYCWMYSTFNIPPNFKGSCAKREHDGNTLYNTYYQWVAIFLVIQVCWVCHGHDNSCDIIMHRLYSSTYQECSGSAWREVS